MKTVDLLRQMRSQGIELHLDQGRLICNAPKGALTASLRQELKDRKKDIISFLAQGQAAVAPEKSTPSIQPAPRDTGLPLAFGQERLWYLNQLDPTSPVYNIPYALRLKGELNEAALRQSLNEILNRHEILQTTFRLKNGKPLQIINPSLTIYLPLINLQDQTEDKRETKLAQLLKRKATQPFNLAEGPLIRASLFRLAEAEHVLLLVLHHIIFDGWSHDIFMHELSALYTAFNARQPSPLSELPIQYADYAVWQRQWMESKDMARQMAYWQKQLASNIPILQLPTDRPQPPIQTYQGAHQSRPFPQRLATTLKQFSRQQQVTLFVTLLAAFKTLLHRYTGQSDIIVCTPIVGREQKETEGLIGYFNNIVTLRTGLADNPSFVQLLSRIQKVVLEAYDNQDVPFQAVADLPNLARTSLTRALFLLPESLGGTFTLPGIEVEPVYIEGETADFDLTLEIKEEAGRLVSTLWYKTDLFSHDAIASILENFQILLEKTIDDPTQVISKLPAFAVTETDQIAEGKSSDLNGVGPNGKYVAPRDTLEVQLVKIWENVFDHRPIGVRDNFFELGGHSLLALHLLTQIEEQLVGQKLPLATLFRAPTIAQLAELICDEGWSATWSSLVPIQPADSRPALFFVHAHGGNVLGYRDLARHLGPDQPFYGLQAQGLDGKAVGPRRFEDMAAHYIKEIRTVQPQGPYYIGGWCLGGYVALEMARHLQAEGEEVALVVMVESAHPDYPKYLPSTGTLRRHLYRVIARLDLEISNFLEVEFGKKFAYSSERISRLVNTIRLKFAGMGYAPGETSPASNGASQIQIQKAVEQTHAEAYHAYRPKFYEGAVAVFRAAKQPLGIYSDPTLGWGELITSELDLQEVPGHYIGLLEEPRVRITANKIRKCLDKAQQSKMK